MFLLKYNECCTNNYKVVKIKIKMMIIPNDNKLILYL